MGPDQIFEIAIQSLPSRLAQTMAANAEMFLALITEALHERAEIEESAAKIDPEGADVRILAQRNQPIETVYYVQAARIGYAAQKAAELGIDVTVSDVNPHTLVWMFLPGSRRATQS